MAKVSLLNEYGEFPIGDEFPCERYVDAPDRSRYHAPHIDRSLETDVEYKRVRNELLEMVEEFDLQNISVWSGGRLKRSCCRDIIYCITRSVTPRTASAVHEVYREFKEGK